MIIRALGETSDRGGGGLESEGFQIQPETAQIREAKMLGYSATY